LGPELAAERGIEHASWLVVSTPRGEIEARAMVTHRLKPLLMDGQIRHQIGLPIHWGYAGETVGAIANDLTSLITDPNVSMHEAKAFACQVRAGRLPDGRRAKPVFAAFRIKDDEPIPLTDAAAQPEGRQRRG
jgi:formate dehydrogenase major subunit